MHTNKKNKCRAYVTLIASLMASVSPALSQETTVLPDVLVIASRFGVDAKKVGSAYSIVTGEQLANSGTVYVSDALRQVPGISVSRAGSFGGITQVRLRGAEANHVLVMIDGIEVSNPVTGEYDFAGLLVQNIDRIEILRGPQSALWGSNATAGVINIITRRAENGTRVTGAIEGGSFSTAKLSSGLFYGTDRVRAAFNAGFNRTGGTNVSSFGSERDGDRNATFSFKGDVDLANWFNLEGVIRYTDRRAEFDPQDFVFPATPTNGLVIDGDRVTKSDEFFGKTTAKMTLLDGNWVHKFNAAITDTRLDTFADGPKSNGTEGRREVFSYLNLFKFETPAFANASHTITSLIERKHETFRNTAPTATPDQAKHQQRTLYGFAGEYRVGLWDQLFLSGALRYDKNDKFKDVMTFRTTAAYVMPGPATRLHGSVGSGVTNPTFFEQFGFSPATFDGNPNLKPEKSIGWDIGVEQSFFEKMLSIDVTYFHANLTDEIQTTFDFATFRTSVTNLAGKSQRHGVEITAKAHPTSDIDIVVHYTYTRSKDATGATEVRRPRHIASFNATTRFMEGRATANLGIAYNGKNEDLEFIAATPATRVILDDFVLVSLAGSYQINEIAQWYGRVENALNQKYQEVFSFNSPGIAAYTGVRFKF